MKVYVFEGQCDVYLLLSISDLQKGRTLGTRTKRRALLAHTRGQSPRLSCRTTARKARSRSSDSSRGTASLSWFTLTRMMVGTAERSVHKRVWCLRLSPHLYAQPGLVYRPGRLVCPQVALQHSLQWNSRHGSPDGLLQILEVSTPVNSQVSGLARANMNLKTSHTAGQPKMARRSSPVMVPCLSTHLRRGVFRLTHGPTLWRHPRHLLVKTTTIIPETSGMKNYRPYLSPLGIIKEEKARRWNPCRLLPVLKTNSLSSQIPHVADLTAACSRLLDRTTAEVTSPQLDTADSHRRKSLSVTRKPSSWPRSWPTRTRSCRTSCGWTSQRNACSTWTACSPSPWTPEAVSPRVPDLTTAPDLRSKLPALSTRNLKAHCPILLRGKPWCLHCRTYQILDSGTLETKVSRPIW